LCGDSVFWEGIDREEGRGKKKEERGKREEERGTAMMIFDCFRRNLRLIIVLEQSQVWTQDGTQGEY
jgi:hypothetical protein